MSEGYWVKRGADEDMLVRAEPVYNVYVFKKDGGWKKLDEPVRDDWFYDHDYDRPKDGEVELYRKKTLGTLTRIDNYRLLYFDALTHTDDWGVDGCDAEIYMLIKKFFEAVKDEPRGYEYAYFSVERAKYDIGNDHYAAKKYGAEAYKTLSKMPPSEENERLMLRAVKLIATSCNELNDWRGVDRLEITRLNYELTKKYPEPDEKYKTPTELIEAAVDYAGALLDVGRLSEDKELQKLVVDKCERLSDSDDVRLARRLEKILLACGAKKCAKKIRERISENKRRLDEECAEYGYDYDPNPGPKGFLP